MGTMEMGLGVSPDTTRTLEDVALTTLGRSVKLGAVAVRRFRPFRRKFVPIAIVPVTSYGRALYENLTKRATFVHGGRRSTSRFIHITSEWSL